MTRFRLVLGTIVFVALIAAAALARPTLAYPPGVGITGKEATCLGCHVNNGPWTDEQRTIIDILDSDSRRSFRQADGTFAIEAKRGLAKTVLTVIGRARATTGLRLIAMPGSTWIQHN